MVGLRGRFDEIGQTSDTGKGPERPVAMVKRDAKYFFDAKGEFEHVERVEAEAATDERRMVGNFIWLKQVHPKQIGDELLQSRKQRIRNMTVVIHASNLPLKAGSRHGV